MICSSPHAHVVALGLSVHEQVKTAVFLEPDDVLDLLRDKLLVLLVRDLPLVVSTLR